MKFEIPEPEEWLSAVKNGTGNIPAAWAVERGESFERKARSKERKQGSDIYEEAKKHAKPTRRQMAGMDFIQKGKLHR